jgi:uncharacterized RDD family membrane protein YckC
MPAYRIHQILHNVDTHTIPILLLCALALIGNYVFWLENLIVGFRRRTFTMPVPCILFFVCHDLTYVANFHRWFVTIGHWFPELWWFGLVLTSLMELAFLYQFLLYGRRELAPGLSQRAFVAATFAALAGTCVPWLVIKHAMNDPMFLTIFGFTVFWCTPFYLALQWRRQDPVGQSVKGWLAFLLMPLCYWPATWILTPGFHTALWDALGLTIVLGALANLACVPYLTGQRQQSPLDAHVTPATRTPVATAAG